MFKSKLSFIVLMVFILTFGVYSFAGDIIYIVKRSLDERVSTLERKVALMDLYFSTNGVELERVYGPRVRMIREDNNCHREVNEPVIVIGTDQQQYQEPVNPRNQGRYMVSFKNGSKMVIVTFEKTKVVSNGFDSRSVKEVYTFHLENGRRVNYSIKDVDDIKFVPYNSVREND